jgi:CHAD domain-containing protein
LARAKAVPTLRPEKIRTFAAESALQFVSAMYENFVGVRSNGDAGALHDMRVATRRLRETLQLFQSFYSPPRLRKVLKKIKSTTRILGLPREMDVNACLLQAYQPSGGLVIQTTYEHLLTLFEAEQSRLKQKMLKAFDKLALERFEPNLRSFVQSSVPPQGKIHRLFEEHQTAEFDRFKSELPQLFLTKADPVLNFKMTDKALEDDVALHELRIATKKLRYAFEILKPFQLNASVPPPIDECKVLQDIVGESHDRVALIDRLRRHQTDLTARGFLLLTHGCNQIASDFLSEKAELRIKIRSAHQQLVRSVTEYLQPALPVPVTSTGQAQSR